MSATENLFWSMVHTEEEDNLIGLLEIGISYGVV